LFEPVFRRVGPFGIEIGMVNPSEALVGLLDFVLIGGRIDLENLIVSFASAH
jgi:hypothetical protein